MTRSGDQREAPPRADRRLTQMRDVLEQAGDAPRLTIAGLVESPGTLTLAPLARVLIGCGVRVAGGLLLGVIL